MLKVANCIQDSVDYMTSHPSVLSSGVGMYGISKGAEIAQLTALHNDKVGFNVTHLSFVIVKLFLNDFITCISKGPSI